MDSETIDRHMKVTRILLAAVTVIVSVTFLLMFFRFFELEKYASPEAWGQLGDYFGGVLNPIVGACTLYWLLISVRIQRTELGETRDALQKTQLAAESQARISLLSARIESINIRLGQLSSQITYRRQLLLFYVERVNGGDPNRQTYNTAGVLHDPFVLMQREATRIGELQTEAFSLTEQLNSVVAEAEKTGKLLQL